MDDQSFSIADVEAFVSRFYGGKPLLLTPYAYNVTFAALAQGAQATSTVNIAANADFVLLGFHHRANIAAAQTVGSKTAPFVRMLVIDSGSNEQFTASAVDLENYSSNGSIPNNLSYPRIVAGRSTLTIQMTNYAPTAETYSIDLMMEGVLVRALQG